MEVKRLWHGTKTDFENFSLEFMGLSNGVGEGYGLYLSESKEKATAYGHEGFLLQCEVKLSERSFTNKEYTIKPHELKKFIEVINDKFDYLENFGEIDLEGYQTVFKRAYETLSAEVSDVDLICGIYNTTGEWEILAGIVNDVFGVNHAVTRYLSDENHGYLLNYGAYNDYVLFNVHNIEIVEKRNLL